MLAHPNTVPQPEERKCFLILRVFVMGGWVGILCGLLWVLEMGCFLLGW